MIAVIKDLYCNPYTIDNHCAIYYNYLMLSGGQILHPLSPMAVSFVFFFLFSDGSSTSVYIVFIYTISTVFFIRMKVITKEKECFEQDLKKADTL